MPAAAVPKLAWAPCDGSGGMQCATARVPLDYRQPGGAKITIQLIRHLATDPAHRIGSLFINIGGPSEQVSVFPVEVYPALPAAIRARYDIVTFDPRGFSHSTPIRCFSSEAAEAAFFAGTPFIFAGTPPFFAGGTPAFPVGAAQQAAFERTFARFDALCGQRNGPLLDHDTSADTARDMDLLRQAVHDPVLNYYGISYGTGLGEDYANLFPGKVGHMLLDASFDPVTWSSTDGTLPVFLRDGDGAANAEAMTGFLTLCGQASTSACAFSAGSPAATRAKWSTLLARLQRHPVTIGSPPQAVTYASVITAAPPAQAAQWPQEAAELQQDWIASGTGTTTAGRGAVAQAASGRGNPAGSGPAPGSVSPAAAAGTISPALPPNGIEQVYALLCDDTSNPRNPGSYPAIARNAARSLGGFGPEEAWIDEPCAQWPGNGAQDRYTGPWNRPTANPVLVFGNTGDPYVNYRDSVAAARDLGNARLLTINQFGHSEALNPDACATSYEVSYLLTGALPPAGTVCQADAPPFPAP